MRFTVALVAIMSAIASSLLVSATPVTTDLVIRSPTIVSTTRHVYAANGAKLATIKDGDTMGLDLATLEPLANPEIVTKAFDAAVSITQAVCTNGGPVACGVVGAIAVFGVFFSLWYGRRELDGPLIDVNTDYPAVSGCGTICRLKFEAEEGPWRSIGNVSYGVLALLFHPILSLLSTRSP